MELTKDIYEDLRPYRDSEIPAAMVRLADYGMLKDICDYTFPDMPLDEIRRNILASRTSDEFQSALGFPLLESVIAMSMSAFTYGGKCEAEQDKGHLYISNHRDIVLDGALLQYVMRCSGLPTTEITFGSNLISPGFIEDFGRSNKMFKIDRGGAGRDLVQNSQILSAHLHKVVDEGRSIWISQRDGRTKDGNDRTDQGLAKMLTMDGSDRGLRESLKSLNIIPFAISYEYESCDALKARETYISRRGTYAKQPGEDLRSILTGIQQYKGEVHLELCEPITDSEIDSLTGENNNEVLRNMASLIDSRIISAYKLHKTNYIAYDIRSGGTEFSDKYSAQEREKFTEYLRRQADSVSRGSNSNCNNNVSGGNSNCSSNVSSNSNCSSNVSNCNMSSGNDVSHGSSLSSDNNSNCGGNVSSGNSNCSSNVSNCNMSSDSNMSNCNMSSGSNVDSNSNMNCGGNVSGGNSNCSSNVSSSNDIDTAEIFDILLDIYANPLANIK